MLIFAVFGACASDAMGQECPASVDDSNSRRLLSGMEIIEGRLHEQEGGNALLRPETVSDVEYFWKFRRSIGSSEVWMRCIYRDTQVRVTQRVGATATECRVVHTHSANPGDGNLVHATCSARTDSARTLEVDRVIHSAESLTHHDKNR
jgi:hypothetical protein